MKCLSGVIGVIATILAVAAAQAAAEPTYYQPSGEFISDFVVGASDDLDAGGRRAGCITYRLAGKATLICFGGQREPSRAAKRACRDFSEDFRAISTTRVFASGRRVLGYTCNSSLGGGRRLKIGDAWRSVGFSCTVRASKRGSGWVVLVCARQGHKPFGLQVRPPS